MAITLNQIPGFADVADSNFAAEQFAIGLNFQRLIDNAKFGVVRPEFFVGKYINGDTVTLPTSVVDGYTYSREELLYVYHYALSGGTSTGNNGSASAAGAVRYMNAYINQLTGAVSTSVEYLVADGSGPNVTSDGTLEVFTIATRRQTSLVVASPPVYNAVLDSEVATDNAVTQSIMQRMNDNAKFAALRSEVVLMGEFINEDIVPQPVSPSDGYVYQYSEVIFQYSWRWTTLGTQFVDPTVNNYKQIRDISCEINGSTGAVQIQVVYYNSGNYPTNYGRVTVFAFCQRNIGNLGSGVINFVDLDPYFLASGMTDREDVMLRQLQNTRYAMLRREFFQADYSNAQTVVLPVSPIDGYQYSRDELSYVYDYGDTGRPQSSDIRINNWQCLIDQATGIVSSTIVRLHDGGSLVTTHDGLLRVLTFARRNHAGESSADYPYEAGNGVGGVDIYALQDGGFDSWNNPTDQTASSWSVYQQSGSGYGAQAPGIVSGYSQRLGNAPSSNVNPDPLTGQVTSALSSPNNISVLSSSVSAVSGQLIYLSWVQRPSSANIGGLTITIYFYDAIGDVVYITTQINSVPLAGGLTQINTWFQVPSIGNSTTPSNSTSATGGITPIEKNLAPYTLDFIPSTLRVEFFYDGVNGSYVDIDQVTLINQVDPSAGQIAQRGSSSLAFFPAISWQITDTTFTPNLSFAINRADGTVTQVTDGAGVTVTGLKQSTTYTWYPYFNETLGHVQNVTTGGVGSPPWLQAMPTQSLYAQWYDLANLPLSATPISVVTLATPVGGGPAPPTGGSGGGGTGSGGYNGPRGA